MNSSFGETLKNLRIKNGISQQQIADRLFVSRSSVANWESGRRKPDLVIILRLAKIFNIDPSSLIDTMDAGSVAPEVIVVDDERFLLQGVIPTLEETMPEANITGFMKVSEAIEFARKNKISIAFLDIEIGTS